jgi:hypothetical protein
MWLEAGMLVLLLLTLVQSFVLWRMWQQSRRLQQQVGALWQGVVHAGTDVPTSMLVAALGRVERQLSLGQLPTPARQSYELAQQLAREGVDIEQLVVRCGLSRDEARLVLQMHPVNA